VRHVYECPTRWADLDLLGHVNNVVYADYLQEARVDLMRGLLPHRESGEGIVVVRHTLDYRRPLGFRFRPVTVETWVAEVRPASFTLGYEVFHTDDDGERLVYLRASSVLAPFVLDTGRPRRITAAERAALEPYVDDGPVPEPARPTTPSRDRAVPARVPVRFSDLDVYRHVNNVTYLEYLQESRLRMLTGLARDAGVALPQIVVAQADVDYVRPMVLRPEPYTCWSDVVATGRTSMTIDAEIADGDTTMARGRVTVVFIDVDTGRPTSPPDGLFAHIGAR
jgi:acyl-CoA thioester hydrolase